MNQQAENIRTVEVQLGARSYPVYIGPGVAADADLWTPHLAGRQTLLVTNETVRPLHGAMVEQALAAAGAETDVLTLPDGEHYKTLETANRIFDRLIDQRFGRDCTVVALGGGVVGDIAGFAAACYQRGVAHIQLPTTLVAQVDSSVGGKTGVNHPQGKNMIGAFHQPACVVADTDTLATLAERELRAGLAEVIKYALIGDTDFLAWLEGNMAALLEGDPEALGRAVAVSCEAKAAIVAADEREGGRRALLNLGHTFGHAIETGTGYTDWLHGEAVAVGMLMAADLSRRLGWLSDTEYERVGALLARAGLPRHAPASLDAERFTELMAGDKKIRGGRLRLVLLRGLGEAVVTADFDDDRLAETLAGFPRR